MSAAERVRASVRETDPVEKRRLWHQIREWAYPLEHEFVPGTGKPFGDYELFERRGQGGQGQVHAARHTRTGAYVALKFTNLESPEQHEALAREARIAAQFDHPHLVRILDHAFDHAPFVVMELVEGESLDRLIDPSSPLSVQEVLRWGQQIASGLAYAHQYGLVHRDLKPGNLMIREDGKAVLVDFGLAVSANTGPATERGMTALYASPEQAGGALELDGRSDIYSLGATLYEALSGKAPFAEVEPAAVRAAVASTRPVPLKELCPDLSPWVLNVVDRAMARDPADRYSSAAELECDLQSLLDHRRPLAALSPLPRAWRHFRTRHPGLLRFLTVSGLLVLLIAGLVSRNLFVEWRETRAVIEELECALPTFVDTLETRKTTLDRRREIQRKLLVEYTATDLELEDIAARLDALDADITHTATDLRDRIRAISNRRWAGDASARLGTRLNQALTRHAHDARDPFIVVGDKSAPPPRVPVRIEGSGPGMLYKLTPHGTVRGRRTPQPVVINADGRGDPMPHPLWGRRVLELRQPNGPGPGHRTLVHRVGGHDVESVLLVESVTPEAQKRFGSYCFLTGIHDTDSAGRARVTRPPHTAADFDHAEWPTETEFEITTIRGTEPTPVGSIRTERIRSFDGHGLRVAPWRALPRIAPSIKIECVEVKGVKFDSPTDRLPPATEVLPLAAPLPSGERVTLPLDVELTPGPYLWVTAQGRIPFVVAAQDTTDSDAWPVRIAVPDVPRPPQVPDVPLRFVTIISANNTISASNTHAPFWIQEEEFSWDDAFALLRTASASGIQVSPLSEAKLRRRAQSSFEQQGLKNSKDRELYPLTKISVDEAAQWARLANRLLASAELEVRLPTFGQFLAAGRGPFDWTYSYGPDFRADFQNSVNAKPRYQIDPAGEHPFDISVFGVRDLGANVAEWVLASDRRGQAAGGSYPYGRPEHLRLDRLRSIDTARLDVGFRLVIQRRSDPLRSRER